MSQATTSVMRFPKVQSPFERSENSDGHYTVDDEINDGFEWVIENDDVLAVEKLHGTNAAVRVETTEQGLDVEAWTRHGMEPMQRADPYGSRAHQHIVRAVQNSLTRGYIPEESGVHYGEVVGPDFHGNAHELNENLFIPFSWLAEKCAYTSWGKYPKTLDALRKWFSTELFSLFYARMHGKDLDSASVSEGTFCEGVVFVHPDAVYTEEITTEEQYLSGGRYRKTTPHLAKLRRDMFGGYQRDEWPMTEYGNH